MDHRNNASYVGFAVLFSHEVVDIVGESDRLVR
jgi:hypothetical protein